MKIRIQQTSGRRSDRRTDGPAYVLDSASARDAASALLLINAAINAAAYMHGWDDLIVHTSDDPQADGEDEDWTGETPDGWELIECDGHDVSEIMSLFDHVPEWDGSSTRWDGNNDVACPIWDWAASHGSIAPQSGDGWTAHWLRGEYYPEVVAREGWVQVAEMGDGYSEVVLVDAPDGVEYSNGELIANDDEGDAWIEALGETDQFELDLGGNCDGYHALFARADAVQRASALGKQSA